jgi:predicted DNA-binding transcriptional regulator YafY
LSTVIRHAIRDSRKMRIDYQDEAGRRTEPVIQPFAVAYYVQATLVCAWCELRNDIRHFRTDPIVATAVLDEPFKIPDAVIAAWAAERDDQ